MKSECRRAFARAEVLVVLAGLGLSLGLLLPAVLKARDVSGRVKCAENFKQLGLAIHQYADAQDGFLPTPRTTPGGGRLTYSMRLLPYLGHEKLARNYRSDLPWSAPENAAVVQTRLAVVQCPDTPKPDRWIEGKTADGTAFKAAPFDYPSIGQITTNTAIASLFPEGFDRTGTWSSSKFSEVGDGLSTTLMGIVEIADKPNSWRDGKLTKTGEPRGGTGSWSADGGNALRGYTWDGSAIPGPCAMNCSNSAAVYSFHPEGCNFLFADGSVRFLNKKLDVWTFYAIITRNGGEVLSPEDF